MSPARRLLGYFRPYAARYGVGVGCLALATGFSLGIPWQVKEAVDSLRGGGGALGFHAGLIVVLAALHALARLGSRFTMLGAGQGVEHGLRRDLDAHLETLSPAFYLTHRTGSVECVDNIRPALGHGPPRPGLLPWHRGPRPRRAGYQGFGLIPSMMLGGTEVMYAPRPAPRVNSDPAATKHAARNAGVQAHMPSSSHE